MSHRRQPVGGPLAAIMVVVAVLFSGCGAGTPVPGAAAVVGDRTIKRSAVDTLASDFCTASAKQWSGQGQAYPMALLRTAMLQSLVQTAVAEQVADHYGVGPGAAYRSEYASAEVLAQSLPEGQAEAVLTIDQTPKYLAALQSAVGRRVLMDAGLPEPTESDAAAAGQQAMIDWVDEHGIEIDPGYNLGFDGMTPFYPDRATSFGVSDAAALLELQTELFNQGRLPEEERLSQEDAEAMSTRIQSLTKELPADQRCG